MPRLFSYTVRVDDGAAPNPFRGMCTLAICKPAIRRVAEPGDWVVGLGSKFAPSGDLSGCVVYAMRIDKVLSLKEYDERAKSDWQHRIPNIMSPDLAERLGDCIYDFLGGKVKQRPGVHVEHDIKRDLGGRNVLISDHFFYFGNRAIKLPAKFERMCHQTQGHKSDANANLVEPFVSWINSLNFAPGMYGWPDHIVDWQRLGGCGGCSPRERKGSC